jgi:hypothetical protein
MKPNIFNKPIVHAALLALGTAQLQAANTFYDAGDMILFFQKTGSTNTVYVTLGNAADEFRGTVAGTSGNGSLTKTNILNLNTTLTSAFGAGWASDTSIYAGAVAARSSSLSGAVVKGDHNRTVYASQSRNAVGTIGSAESVAWDFTVSGASTNAASNIEAMGNNLENNTTLVAETVPTSISIIDDKNPFLSVPLGIQDIAFNAFGGGVQQRGSASIFGTMGGVSNIEFALDIYRVTARPDSETTGIEVPGVSQVGSFEGTLVIDSAGSVSYLVPEPSSFTLTGLAALGLAFRRRRNS